jgi:23S rRNA (cytosine1962-C5)-methyltransferase
VRHLRNSSRALADLIVPHSPSSPAPPAPLTADAPASSDEALAAFGGLSALWTAWDEERFILRSEDLVVVDKPAGLSTHAPELGGTADVVSRLAKYFTKRGEGSYLGIHQRLDRDTSGVLLFARRKSANAGLARQFEGRTVDKTYVAVVPASVRIPRGGVAEHLVREGEGGRMIADDPGRSRQGKLARTHLRILEKHGDRALVEARPETGRTHQIRVQLAKLGAPIDGDVLYDGASASRLMLHAQRLGIADPTSGAPLSFEAPIPRAIRDHLAGTLGVVPLDVAAIATRLRDAAELRYGVATSGATEALRLVNGAGDALPGVAVDAYGPYLVVSIDGELDEEARARVLDASATLGPRGVYLKVRPKHASVVVDTRRETVAPPHAVRGDDAPDPMLVREHGLSYEVRLGDGLSTGLFLDMRAQRARVRDLARGARVLNLFSYTGSFTVAAAAGGARSTTTVDVARSVLVWAERNMALNHFDGAHDFLDVDVLPWLDAQVARKETWDLVVLDPPSFSTTKSSRFAVDGGYRDLVARVMRVTSPTGHILCCTNHRGVVQAKVRRWIHEAARDAGRRIDKLRDLAPPADFPATPGLEPHLKVLLCSLGEGAPEEPRRPPPMLPRGRRR